MLDTSLLRLHNVVARRGRSRAQLYVDIKRGVMTPPVRIGATLSAWPAHEVDALIRAEISGATEDKLKSLVSQLIVERAGMSPAAHGDAARAA